MEYLKHHTDEGVFWLSLAHAIRRSTTVGLEQTCAVIVASVGRFPMESDCSFNMACCLSRMDRLKEADIMLGPLRTRTPARSAVDCIPGRRTQGAGHPHAVAQDSGVSERTHDGPFTSTRRSVPRPFHGLGCPHRGRYRRPSRYSSRSNVWAWTVRSGLPALPDAESSPVGETQTTP